MDNSKIVFLINDQARAVMGTYEPGAAPEIFKTLDGSLKVNDLAVVQTTTRHGMTVVKITEVGIEVDLDSTVPLKWLVQKIDMDRFGNAQVAIPAEIDLQSTDYVFATRQPRLRAHGDQAFNI